MSHALTWIWPATITVLAYIAALATMPQPHPMVMFYRPGLDLVTVVSFLFATVISLTVWLVWALT